jgi:acetyltransferase-like isoleucine patch superfamily enzyme
MKKIIAFGLSGATKSIVEGIIKNNIDINIDYIYVDKEYKKDDYYHNIPVIDDLSDFKNHYCIIPAPIHELRMRWINLANQMEMEFLNVINKDNDIAKNAVIGKGCIISQKNIIESNVVIGDYFLCGYENRIGHDSVIGNFFHIYVKANVGGFNKIGDNVTISSSACTREYTTIKNNSLVALGAAVFNDVNENSVAIGNPAKIITINDLNYSQYT